MVVYVKVPGSKAGEGNVREGIGGIDQLCGPRKGVRVNIGESEFGGAGAETAGRGINIEVEDIC